MLSSNLLHLTDNSVEDVFSSAVYTDNALLEKLNCIANIPIKHLVASSSSNIIMFPSDNTYKDDVQDNCIFEIYKNKIKTNNVMGYIGVDDLSITISSRFTSYGESSHDYFLHYLLSKVLCYNFINLNHKSSVSTGIEYLVFLFPLLLNRAISQGVFKAYKKHQYNDAKVKGTIEVARHLKLNPLPNGKFAYRTREFDYDNSVTQLVRHTIEFIQGNGAINAFFSNDSLYQRNVALIKQITPSYNIKARAEVISLNSKTLSHPYYTAYADLQKLCLQILSRTGFVYNNGKNSINGVLFDGAWFGEEYLAIILKDTKLVHAKNKERIDGIEVLEESQRRFYPDFYLCNHGIRSLVLDAKYKRIMDSDNSEKDHFSRNDLHQLICYMYLLKASTGGFIFPSTDKRGTNTYSLPSFSYGGNLLAIPFYIPKNASSYEDFILKIRVEEQYLIDSVNNFLG